MDFQIALMLAQDGIVNGAIYALMALALVLVFSVTRVIFIPQGEFVTYAALAMAALQTGKLPAVLWLLVALGALTLVVEAVRQARGQEVDWRSTLLWAVVLPAAAAVLMGVVKPQSMLLQALAVLLLVVPMGPLVYRLAYRPLADATVLILLIVSVALHLAMVGLGLYFFGAEGSRTAAFSEARWDVGGLMISGQSVVIVGATAVLVVAMFFFFERTIIGKALRATAINRVGARLMGIPTALSGDLSFALAALILRKDFLRFFAKLARLVELVRNLLRPLGERRAHRFVDAHFPEQADDDEEGEADPQRRILPERDRFMLASGGVSGFGGGCAGESDERDHLEGVLCVGAGGHGRRNGFRRRRLVDERGDDRAGRFDRRFAHLFRGVGFHRSDALFGGGKARRRFVLGFCGDLGDLCIELLARVGRNRARFRRRFGERLIVRLLCIFGLLLEVGRLIEIVGDPVTAFFKRAAKARQHDARHDEIEEAKRHQEPEDLAREGRRIHLRQAGA